MESIAAVAVIVASRSCQEIPVPLGWRITFDDACGAVKIDNIRVSEPLGMGYRRRQDLRWEDAR
jgi:hypothetical protein